MDWLFGVKYKVWVINTSDKAKIYLWDNYKEILPNLNNLVSLTHEDAFIRSYQSILYENNWLGFGRMKWNEANNLKWTTKHRNNLENENKITFNSTEIWSPDWNFCCNKGKTPNLFIKLYNANYENVKEGFLIAMPIKLLNKNFEFIETNINEIKNKISNASISTIERYWTPSRKFYNRIEDMNMDELHKIVSSNS